MAFGIAMVTGSGGRPNPGFIIGGVFSVAAAISWIAATFGDAERWYRALGVDEQ